MVVADTLFWIPKNPSEGRRVGVGVDQARLGRLVDEQYWTCAPNVLEREGIVYGNGLMLYPAQ